MTFLMISSRELLRVIVTTVVVAWALVYIELFLLGPILKPVEAHINYLGAFLFEIVIHKSDGGGVINLNWYRWLGMVEEFQNLPKRKGFFSILEGGSNLSFGGRLHDVLQNTTMNVNGSIWFSFGWVCAVIREEVMPSRTASSLWKRQIRAIGVYMEYHTATIVSNLGIWICGGVVKQMY